MIDLRIRKALTDQIRLIVFGLLVCYGVHLSRTSSRLVAAI